ncbi:hypothetical protein Cob_v004648 [Colletotrichum orbiculare MAFF 240422]|uniref:Uncharacterized protein n=1 Tax=Colletotrichum orbiculare (strain 104-T / ATCC 96160 / CBS 514.97 / LARS 414 / MAFF 240422) TaxID=1213857 RepID=A0A484FWV0_COLOR|nr:hypothetical protein Cob_v004648 [Colletotrichum orbiculare MAFF 240422]
MSRRDCQQSRFVRWTDRSASTYSCGCKCKYWVVAARPWSSYFPRTETHSLTRHLTLSSTTSYQPSIASPPLVLLSAHKSCT